MAAFQRELDHRAAMGSVSSENYAAELQRANARNPKSRAVEKELRRVKAGVPSLRVRNSGQSSAPKSSIVPTPENPNYAQISVNLRTEMPENTERMLGKMQGRFPDDASVRSALEELS